MAQTCGMELQTARGEGFASGFFFGPGPVEVKRARLVISTRGLVEFCQADFRDGGEYQKGQWACQEVGRAGT
jgi:hypothetical protein